jgi:peptide/nickel transport system permease protein
MNSGERTHDGNTGKPFGPRRARGSGARSRPFLPGWLPWLGGRLLSGLGTILAISAIVYLATLALPSDPARVILGPEATPGAVALLREQLGLNRPIPVQYADWLIHAVTGHFGNSLDSGVAAFTLVTEGWTTRWR